MRRRFGSHERHRASAASTVELVHGIGEQERNRKPDRADRQRRRQRHEAERHVDHEQLRADRVADQQRREEDPHEIEVQPLARIHEPSLSLRTAPTDCSVAVPAELTPAHLVDGPGLGQAELLIEPHRVTIGHAAEESRRPRDRVLLLLRLPCPSASSFARNSSGRS